MEVVGKLSEGRRNEGTVGQSSQSSHVYVPPFPRFRRCRAKRNQLIHYCGLATPAAVPEKVPEVPDVAFDGIGRLFMSPAAPPLKVIL